MNKAKLQWNNKQQQWSRLNNLMTNRGKSGLCGCFFLLVKAQWVFHSSTNWLNWMNKTKRLHCVFIFSKLKWCHFLYLLKNWSTSSSSQITGHITSSSHNRSCHSKLNQFTYIADPVTNSNRLHHQFLVEPIWPANLS